MSEGHALDEIVRSARQRGIGWGGIARMLMDLGYTAGDLRASEYPEGWNSTIHATLVRRFGMRKGIE